MNITKYLNLIDIKCSNVVKAYIDKNYQLMLHLLQTDNMYCRAIKLIDLDGDEAESSIYPTIFNFIDMNNDTHVLDMIETLGNISFTNVNRAAYINSLEFVKNENILKRLTRLLDRYNVIEPMIYGISYSLWERILPYIDNNTLIIKAIKGGTYYKFPIETYIKWMNMDSGRKLILKDPEIAAKFDVPVTNTIPSFKSFSNVSFTFQ